MLTTKNIKEHTLYNPITGIFTWIKPTNKTTSKGDDIGCIKEQGSLKYKRTKLNGKSIAVHRVIFLYMTGDIPACIDHIDGNGLNNKWNNLREATPSENQRNTKLRSANKSGIMGVRWDKARSKWRSQIRDNTGRQLQLGSFSDFFIACCARKSAEIKYSYHPNHGRQS